MLNEKISTSITKRIYYGWIIIAMAALSVFFSAPGQTYSISTFIDSYISEFGFSRTSISTLYSVATIISGTLLVFMGRAVDKHGQKNMMVVAGLMLAAACLFSSFITNIVMVFLGFFLLRYFGQGSLTLIPGSLVPQWFEKKRALAISLYTFGGILANMFVPALNIWMINHFSWQVTWRIWSILLIIVFVPLASLLVVNKPEDIGLLPDNQKIKNESDLKDEIKRMEKESWTLNEALKTKEFWFIGIISMIPPMISTGLMFHFFSIMSLKGIDGTAASFVIGLVALPGFIMPIIAGLIIDKVRSKYLVLITLSVITIDMVFVLFVNSPVTASIFMLIYGLAVNVQGVTIGVIWAKYFGRKHLGSIRGAATVFMVVGSAFGPLPFGLSFDLTGGYNTVFIIMAILTVGSMVMAISIKRPQKQ